MKKTLLRTTFSFLVFVFCSLSLSSQWVSIPDTNFGTWLNTNGYPACMQGDNTIGWQMDTTCPAVVGATWINCSHRNIHDLNGIQYFDNLDTLDCFLDSLSFLPALPSGLKRLSCYSNQLSSLPVLPDSLVALLCYSNPLNALPALPDSLTDLECYYNLLSSLPVLPASLKVLSCFNNQLLSLPNLPTNLVELNCYHNLLTSLPALPDSLSVLICSNNNLLSLPALPPELKILRCYYDSLTSLPALPGILTEMQCYGNQLSSIPALPDSLTYLDCSINYLTTLPALGVKLTYLNCSNNILTSLPVLADSLTYLDCSYNNLTSLPALPDTLLVELHCSYNQLSSLPNLPFNLHYMYCDNNQLTLLPNLPSALSSLDCNYNNLTSLPFLPVSLSSLFCNGNSLSSLPSLPPGLNNLDCSANQLTTLPTLPLTLYGLSCGTNHLTSIPELPAFLDFFYCNDNPNLYCLPALKTIHDFRFDNIGITCLPNYPQNNQTSSPALSSVPLCDVFNTHGCPVYWNIAGITYNDINTNCVQNTADTVLHNIKVQLWSSGNLVQQFFTAGGGEYSFDTDTFGYYDSNIDTTSIPFYISCPSNNLLSDTITPADSMEYGKDFALRCKNGFDLTANSISSLSFRPGTFSNIFISAGDFSNFYNAHCASGISGTITITVTGATHYISPFNNARTPSVNGNVLTYNINDFGSVNFFTDFNFVTETDITAPLGSAVCITVSVTPTAGDYNTTNNSLTHCYTIIGSYDPNTKEVYPNSDVDARGDRWLTYTINFQNTGTDTAFNIYITDTLDANLDVSTFGLLAFSHPIVVQIKGNVVRFNFPNINLLDSNTNEQMSHGYVQYRIKVKSNALPGVIVRNTSYIYFDFNAPVITNTTVNYLTCAPDTFNLAADICDNETYLFNGALLHTAGIYFGTQTDRYGCDSTVKFKLAVYRTSGSQVANICDNETFYFNGRYLNTTGIYYDTLRNLIGCDSIATLTLNVNRTSGNIKLVNLCDNDFYYFNGTMLNSSGVYYDTLSNINGCDSLVMLTIQFLPAAYSTVNDIIFQGYTYTLPSGRTVTMPGTYIDTLVASNSCDSIITVNLITVSSVNTTTTTPQFAIYPNPASNSITLSVDQSMIGGTVTVSDITGRKMMAVQLSIINEQLSIKDFSNGVYFVTVTDKAGASTTKKLVISR